MARRSGSGRRDGDRIALRVEWRSEPRTPVWDQLWVRILADVLADAAARHALDPPRWHKSERRMLGDSPGRVGHA